MKSLDGSSEPFAAAVAAIHATRVRPEFVVEEGPAPARLAPHALALTAEMADLDDDTASGRFVLLHDPDGVEEWGGSFRVVVFVRARPEPDVVHDPLVREVAWSWVGDAIESLACTHVGGTITTTVGESFGTMIDRPDDLVIELRASWTPDESQSTSIDDHFRAWLTLLETAAGLEPLPEGVTAVSGRRSRAHT